MSANRPVLSLIAALLACAAAAETAVITGSSGFKRIKVADVQAGQRITVQIDPEAQALALAALPRVDPDGVDAQPAGQAQSVGLAPLVPSAAVYDWYWERVPPGIGQKDGRFPLALAALSLGPEGRAVSAPRLQNLQEIVDRHGIDILKATVGTRVSPALVLAVISTESGGRVEALSPKGAQGLMQLIPATAARFAVANANDPAQNIKGGVDYLDWLMGKFGGDPLMVIAAYNAGEGAVVANAGVPPYAETRDYVPKVLAAWQVAQGLCLTPPELVSDPCVFKVLSASNQGPGAVPLTP